MDPLEKTKILGDSGRYDSCGPKACEVSVKEGIGGIYTAHAELILEELNIYKGNPPLTMTYETDDNHPSRGFGSQGKP